MYIRSLTASHLLHLPPDPEEVFPRELLELADGPLAGAVQGGEQGHVLRHVLQADRYPEHGPHSMMHSAHYMLHGVHYRRHGAHCMLHSAHYMLHRVHYKLKSTYYILHFLYKILHSKPYKAAQCTPVCSECNYSLTNEYPNIFVASQSNEYFPNEYIRL